MLPGRLALFTRCCGVVLQQTAQQTLPSPNPTAAAPTCIPRRPSPQKENKKENNKKENKKEHNKKENKVGPRDGLRGRCADGGCVEWGCLHARVLALLSTDDTPAALGGAGRLEGSWCLPFHTPLPPKQHTPTLAQPRKQKPPQKNKEEEDKKSYDP